MLAEFERQQPRLAETHGLEYERQTLERLRKDLSRKEDGITDAYVNDAMPLERYQEQMKRLKQQRAELERATRDQDQRERHEYATARALADLERFCQNVVVGVDSLSFEERQRLMRLLIDSVNVEGGLVSI